MHQHICARMSNVLGTMPEQPRTVKRREGMARMHVLGAGGMAPHAVHAGQDPTARTDSCLQAPSAHATTICQLGCEQGKQRWHMTARIHAFI